MYFDMNYLDIKETVLKVIYFRDLKYGTTPPPLK